MDKEATKVYRREVSNVWSWRGFSIPHVAFALHRVTGWLLLAWVGYHLIIPALSGAPTGVQLPGGKVFTVAIVTILLFHGINGIRLLIAESSSWGLNYVEPLFKGTVIMTGLTAIVSWVVV